HRHFVDNSNGFEVGDWIVGKLPIERRRSRHADIMYQERVSVRRRLGDTIGSNGAAGADNIFDDDLLLESFAHRRADQPRDHVGRTTGSKRYNHSDDFSRILLSARL